MKEIEVTLKGQKTILKVYEDRLTDEHQREYMELAMKLNVENPKELKEAYLDLPKLRDRMIEVTTDLNMNEIKLIPLVEKERIADIIFEVLNPLSRFTKG